MKTTFIQEQGAATVDTLTQSYSDKWDAGSNFEEASAFVQFLASNDLIFVVLGVSLVIWFILLFFMIRVDHKVSHLEQKLNLKNKEL